MINKILKEKKLTAKQFLFSDEEDKLNTEPALHRPTA